MSHTIETLLGLLDSSEFSTPNAVQIRAFRLNLGLTTTQASKLAGVGRRTWERYESGKQVLNKNSWLYLKMIANELPRVKVLVVGRI